MGLLENIKRKEEKRSQEIRSKLSPQELEAIALRAAIQQQDEKRNGIMNLFTNPGEYIPRVVEGAGLAFDAARDNPGEVLADIGNTSMGLVEGGASNMLGLGNFIGLNSGDWQQTYRDAANEHYGKVSDNSVTGAVVEQLPNIVGAAGALKYGTRLANGAAGFNAGTNAVKNTPLAWKMGITKGMPRARRRIVSNRVADAAGGVSAGAYGAGMEGIENIAMNELAKMQ